MPKTNIRATFTGIPTEPDVKYLDMFGQVFTIGKAVQVPYPSHAASKLTNHPFFTVRGADVEDAMLKDDKTNVAELQRLMVIAKAVDAEQQSPTFQTEVTNAGDTSATGPANPPKAGGAGGAGSAKPS